MKGKKKRLIPEDNSEIRLVPGGARKLWEKYDEEQRDARKRREILRRIEEARK